MNRSLERRRTRTKATGLALALTAAVALLVSSSGRGSLAQQDPNRQLVQTASAANTGKRVALVIGNSAYPTAPLKNPVNDAQDIAAALRVLGFEVIARENVNQNDMKRAIREFGEKIRGAAVGLFYYAGHGVQVNGENYLVPVDAKIESEQEVEYECVKAGFVLAQMDAARNSMNIVILDACRNNPFARSFRSESKGLAQMDAPSGTLIAYATAPGSVASDGAGRNGLYTQELLKQMQTSGLGIEDVFKQVRISVRAATQQKQTPWESSSLVGAFYFTTATGGETSARPPAVDSAAFELSYWETIKSSTNSEDFKAYLEKYPSGQFASLARNRITSLDAATKPIESKPGPTGGSATELAFWDAIKNSNSAADYRAYLEKYPNGDFASLAKNRLAPLEASERTNAEVAKNTKTFTGYFGVMDRGVAQGFRPGKLEISPTTGIHFVWDKGRDGFLGGKPHSFSQPDPKPYEMQCASFAQAQTEDVFIREIKKKESDLEDVGAMAGSLARFQASSAAEAVAALSAVREACGNLSSIASTTESVKMNSVAGTTWKGDSPGGDKHYVFEFLQNGEVVCTQDGTRFNNHGTWIQTENKVVMDFSKLFGSTAEVTIVEQKMTGGFVSGAYKGRYSFALTKQSTEAGGQTSLVGTTWKGDSSGGDKHYEFKFLPNGEVAWHLKWNQIDYTYKGTWRQTGDTIHMDFHPWWNDPVEATISGDKLAGSWAKGQYKFTLPRVP